MLSLNAPLYLGSLFFQFAALLFAIRMAWRSTFRAPWMIMALALAFMTAFRTIGLVTSGPTPLLPLSHDAFATLTATLSFVISITLFTSLFAIRRLSHREQRASAAVADTQRQFASLIDNTPALIFVKDLQGRYTLVNQPFLRNAGLPADRLLGRTDEQLFGPANAANFRRDDQRVAASGLPHTGEDQFEHAGQRQTFVTTKFPIKDADGHVTGICGVSTDVTQLRRAQTDAHRQALLLDQAGDAAFAWALGGGIVYWNHAAESLYAFPAADAIGLRSHDLLRTRFPDSLESLTRTLLTEGRWQGLLRHTTRDGRVITVDSRMCLVSEPDGGQLVLETAHDVTDQHLRDQTLRESRERLDAALAASRTGTFRWDIRTNSLTWDSNLDRLFGLPPGQTAPSLDRFVALVHSDDRAAVLEACGRCRDAGADFDMEFRVVWPDDSIHWLDDKGRTFAADDGKPLYMTGACVDITPRKQAAVTLAQSETRFRQLADAAPQIVWAAGPDGAVEYFNSRWYDYTGLTPVQSLGEGWASVVHPDDLPALSAKWAASVASGSPFENEHRFRGRDGVYRWHLTRGLPVPDPGAADAPLRWFGTCTDIDRQKSLERDLRNAREEAEHANRTKDEFLAALSHELRTPLTPALMTTQMLEHDPALPEHARAELRNVRRGIEIETRLIDDLLDLTRVSRGKVLLAAAPADVHEIVRHAADTCRDDLFTQKRLRLQLDLTAEWHWTSADATRLGQVFWNLIKNATKFTPSDGVITVASANPAPGRLVITVADTGVGIDPDALPHIFDAFEQGGRHITRRFGGLGLGLSISKALTELHGGSIAARSDGPGRGATFSVILPTIPEPAPTPDTIHPAVPRLRGPGECRSILLVEDHEPTGRVMRRLLAGFGYDVEWADSVGSALRAASGRKFDLVVSDLGLPDGTGHDLMAQLKTLYNLRGVALSGYGMEHDLDRSVAAGFVRHLTKPVTIEKLDAVIRDVCT